MAREFPQVAWDGWLEAGCRALIQLALAEDLGAEGDWTARALVPEGAVRRAAVAARHDCVVAGLQAVGLTLAAVDPRLEWLPEIRDGASIACGTRVGVIAGPAQGILAAERVLLNFLGRLSGIATLTQKYVEAAAGTPARIYDTRKTTPGWRRLEKYAVSCGGGWNHRAGLFAAVLIKDNHLAWGVRKEENSAPSKGTVPFSPSENGDSPLTPAEAVRRARSFLQQHAAEGATELIVEVEVEALDQLADVLREGPDIVLLDNFTPEQLCQAVALRNQLRPSVELEASGGVNLSNVRAVAETGVERISVGALTHAAPASDFGLDAMDLESS